MSARVGSSSGVVVLSSTELGLSCLEDVVDCASNELVATVMSEITSNRQLATSGAAMLLLCACSLLCAACCLIASFKDAAFSLSNVAEEAGKQIEPSEQEQDKLRKPGADSGPPPSGQDLGNEIVDVTKVVAVGAAQVAQDTEQSVEEKLTGDEGQVMMNRLKQAVMKLRQRPDYNDSVSTLSTLIKRYAIAYSRSVEETANALEDDVHENAEMDKAGRNFWALVSSFGDREAWKKLEDSFRQVMSHNQRDPEFENLKCFSRFALEIIFELTGLHTNLARLVNIFH